MSLGSYSALLCRDLGGPEKLAPGQLERLPLKPGEVRLDVQAAGVNFPDLLMLKGEYQYKPPLPFVPGFEAAGRVLDCAPDVTGWKPGDEAMVFCRGGGYAAEIVADARDLLPKPAAWSFAEAAAFPVAASTAWAALAHRGRLQPGETLLVLGAGGGTGLAALQFAASRDVTAIALASSAIKRETALRAGAALALDVNDPGWPDAVRLLTEKRGVDIVFDPVGGAAFDGALRCLKPGGRYLVVGFASGAIPRPPANRLLLKEAELIGVRAGEQARRDAAVAEAQRAALMLWLESGAGRPEIAEILPPAEAARGLARLARREITGKLVLRFA